MAVKILIDEEIQTRAQQYSQKADRISPDDKTLSSSEPDSTFARTHTVKYSLNYSDAPRLRVEHDGEYHGSFSEIGGNKRVTALAAQIDIADQQMQKYLTLLELSKAISSHHELSELFHDIACRLKNLFPFRDLAVMLHDDRRNVMRSYIMEGCEAEWVSQEPAEVAMGNSINGRVWKDQQPIVINNLTEDFRFPAAQVIRDKGIKSVCCLPLTTVHEKLGTLNLWSEDIDAYRNFDIGFAQLVAAQIAV